MTFDLDLWPTDLNINRGHLLIKDYLPTKFEASGAKHSWVISCTRWSNLAWPLTLTFDLLTWKSIGIIYSPRTIYIPSLKLLGQNNLSHQLHKVKGYRQTDRHTDRPTDRPTYRPTGAKQYAPPFSKGGIINLNIYIYLHRINIACIAFAAFPWCFADWSMQIFY